MSWTFTRKEIPTGNVLSQFNEFGTLDETCHLFLFFSRSRQITVSNAIRVSSLFSKYYFARYFNSKSSLLWRKHETKILWILVRLSLSSRYVRIGHQWGFIWWKNQKRSGSFVISCAASLNSNFQPERREQQTIPTNPIPKCENKRKPKTDNRKWKLKMKNEKRKTTIKNEKENENKNWKTKINENRK